MSFFPFALMNLLKFSGPILVIALACFTSVRASDDVFRTIVRKPAMMGPRLIASRVGDEYQRDAPRRVRHSLRGVWRLAGDIDVGLRRSTDGGRTWEAQQVIIDFDKSVPNSRGTASAIPRS